MSDYDVIVVGGGPAGICATVQAARAGARTLLIEKNGLLGGTLTAGGVNFPGLFHAWGEQVIATNLDPTVLQTIIVSRQSGTIRLDVFRSGAVAKGGTGIATAVLRSPVSSITTTGTVFAETRIGDPFLTTIVVTTNVDFSSADVVWVDDELPWSVLQRY